MNRDELVKEIAGKANISQKVAAEALTATINAIVNAVANGDKVALIGFGTFEARKRAARTGRNPQTGEVMSIPEKTVPAFSAGKKFKEAVKG